MEFCDGEYYIDICEILLYLPVSKEFLDKNICLRCASYCAFACPLKILLQQWKKAIQWDKNETSNHP